VPPEAAPADALAPVPADADAADSLAAADGAVEATEAAADGLAEAADGVGEAFAAHPATSSVAIRVAPAMGRAKVVVFMRPASPDVEVRPIIRARGSGSV
jgi:hypothetical protein